MSFYINKFYVYLSIFFCFSTCLLPLIIRKRVFRLLCSWTFQLEHQQQAGESFLKEGDGLQNRLNPNVGGGGYVVFLVTSKVHFPFELIIYWFITYYNTSSKVPHPLLDATSLNKSTKIYFTLVYEKKKSLLFTLKTYIAKLVLLWQQRGLPFLYTCISKLLH